MLFHHQLRFTTFVVGLSLVVLPAKSNAQILLTPAGGEATFSSPSISSYSLSGWGGGRRLPSDTIQMLRMPQIMEELGLRDNQKAAIGKLADEMQKQIREVFQSADFGGPDMGRIMREAQRTIRRKTEEKLEELLLPEQLTRLKQIRVQTSLKNQGARALLSGELADDIRLSDKQKTELQQVHAKKQKELEAEIEALRAQYREDTLKEVLTDSQLRDLEKLAGEQYEIKQPNYRSMYPNLVPQPISSEAAKSKERSKE